MLRSSLLLLVIFILFPSCSDKEIKVPAGVISQDSIVMILTDIHLTESIITHTLQQKDSIDKYRIVYYETLFRKYNITEEEFNESYRFYQENMTLLEKIHDDVIIELSKRQ